MGPLIGILLCECDGNRVSCLKLLELARLLSQLSYRPKCLNIIAHFANL